MALGLKRKLYIGVTLKLRMEAVAMARTRIVRREARVEMCQCPTCGAWHVKKKKRG